MAHDVDPKGLDAALDAHFTAAGDDVSQMEAAISAYLAATQPTGEVEAGIVGRLHKRADQLGMLLSDPPKPHPDAVLIREGAAALTAALRGRDEARKATVRLQDSNSKMAQEWTALLHRAEAAESRAAALQRDLDQANRTIEFVQSWAWRESSKLSDSERLSAIQYHPAIHARDVIEGDGT